MRRHLVALCGLAWIASSIACGDPVVVEPSLIAVDHSDIRLAQFEQSRIVASVVTRGGSKVLGATLTYESSNPLLVRTTNDGDVSSVGPAGSATVTIRSGTLTRAVPVEVTQVVGGLFVSPPATPLLQQRTIQLVPVVLDKTNDQVFGVPVSYSSSRPAIATVSSTGLVSSVGPADTVTIGVRCLSILTEVHLAVTPVAKRITIAPPASAMYPGFSLRLTAQVWDAIDAPMSAPLVWQSLTPSVASVNADGLVTALGPLGTAQLRVTVREGSPSVEQAIDVVQFPTPIGDVPQLLSSPLIYALDVISADSVIGASFGDKGELYSLTHRTVRTFDAPPVLGMVVSRSRGLVYISSSDGQFYELNLATFGWRSLKIADGLYDVALGPNERYAYIGVPATKEVAIVDVLAWREVGRVSTNSSGLHFAVANGTKLYVSGQHVAELDFNTGASRVLPIDGITQGVVVSPDGRSLFVFDEGLTIRKYDVATVTLNQSWIAPCHVWGGAISPDGRLLVVTCPRDRQVAVVDANSGGTRSLYSGYSEGRRVRFSLDGSVAYVATNEGLLIVH